MRLSFYFPDAGRMIPDPRSLLLFVSAFMMICSILFILVDAEAHEVAEHHRPEDHRQGHGFCPSCCGRRMAELAAHLTEHIFPDVPGRQWVITFPADRPRRGRQRYP
jgi:hypothetical protein